MKKCQASIKYQFLAEPWKKNEKSMEKKSFHFFTTCQHKISAWLVMDIFLLETILPTPPWVCLTLERWQGQVPSLAFCIVSCLLPLPLIIQVPSYEGSCFPRQVDPTQTQMTYNGFTKLYSVESKYLLFKKWYDSNIWY